MRRQKRDKHDRAFARGYQLGVHGKSKSFARIRKVKRVRPGLVAGEPAERTTGTVTLEPQALLPIFNTQDCRGLNRLNQFRKINH